MKYGLNDKPDIAPLLMYGLQWWIVSVPTIVIMGVIVGKLHYSDAAEQIFYLQKLFGIIGFSLVIQILWGHRLPLIIGPASVLLIGILASMSASISAIYTGVFAGGILLTIIAFSGLLKKLQVLFTPRIVTVILILIAFTLTPVIINMVFGDDKHLLLNLVFALILVFALVIGNTLLRGVWKSTTVLWGVIAGSVVYYALIGFPTTSSPVNNGLIPVGVSVVNLPLTFDGGVMLAFFFCFIALIVNELGSIQAVGHMLNADNLTKRTRRGMGIVGLSNILSGLTGVIGPVDYSMSPGVIAATGCASRYPLLPAGILLMACAFFPGIIGVLVNIPGAVMGTILLYLMSSQLAAGVQMLVKEKAVDNFDSAIIIGLPLMVALFVSFAPAGVISQMPHLLRPIIGNGFVMGVITVIFLEHIIFKRKK